MSIKTSLISTVALFALAIGMANIGGSATVAAKTTTTTPYGQSLMIAQGIASHQLNHQAASAK